MKNRRSITPSTGVPAGGVHATRRGGARKEVSARVILASHSGEELHGWALNVSKGGVRVILEEHVPLGGEYAVTVVDATGPSGPHPGRIVWLQDEPDGVVAGIEFRLEDDAGARGKS